MKPRWSSIVLSQGNRPAELARAVDSLLAQTGVELEVVVVGNGWVPVGLPDGVRTVHSPTNVGPPKGRNIGLKTVRGRYVFFLDDDAYLPNPDTLAGIEHLFATEDDLGVVQTRIRTPDGETLARWVPRMRGTEPERGSEAFSVLEGSVAVRSAVLRRTKNWAGRFFYAHEGVELAWRAWDAGYRVEYRPEFEAVHPRVDPSRHDDHLWLDARNRVWLARRNLPLPVGVAYVGCRMAISLARNARRPASAAAVARGAWAGVRTPAGRRRPIAWSTVWEMTRRGRPPII